MYFQVDDRVVYPTFGVGRVVGRVTMAFGQAEQQDYYEIASERSTTWVPVAESPGLRRLTRKDELARYRHLLGGRPSDLNPDFRQRHLDMRSKAREGTLVALCEVVRDLRARGWRKPLSEGDANVLRLSHQALCQEWAAADDVSLPDATAEVNALLLEAQTEYQA
jgi:RNA polymerase-interacting CarD/CdnL/TRCF family regulator